MSKAHGTFIRRLPDARWSVVGAVAVAGAMSLAGEAGATVSSTLVADRYIVTDGAKTYAVLDVYVKGNHLGDVMSTAVTGLNGTAGHEVIFATSKATGVTRDATTGKITSGAITGDAFVQAGGSSWKPTYAGAEAWDSFVTLGARKQNASITNRAGTRVGMPNYGNYSATIQPGNGFTQFAVANSNFINNGGDSGWLSALGSNPYSSAVASENPFARVSLYNSTWNSTYPDLDRTGVLTSKGGMYNGAASAGAALSAAATSGAGSSLDFMWMVGRFAVDVTSETSPITMQVQFNMVGRNGTANETGTIFTGALTASYKVSQFFAFAMRPSCPSDLDGNLVVDPADVSLMLLDFGPCFGCPSDLDGSGVTDTADVSLLLLEFGACP